MKIFEIRPLLLLSAQRALLGMIYPSIRAITVGFVELKILRMTYYLDREPNKEDYENISEVTSEICADIEFSRVEEICEYNTFPLSKLDTADIFVYKRQEK